MDLHLKLGCQLIIYVTILAPLYPSLLFFCFYCLLTIINYWSIYLFSIFTAFFINNSVNYS